MTTEVTIASSETEVKVERLQHTWTIKNFSHIYQENLEQFVDLKRGNGREPLKWSLKVYPEGNGENNRGFTFLCLNRVIDPKKREKAGEIGIKMKFKLRNSDGKEIDIRIHPNPSHSDYVAYVKRDVLLPQIMQDDIIIVDVEIDVAVETVTTNFEPIQDIILVVPDL